MFYDDDAELGAVLGAYAAGALRSGAVVLTITTPGHRAALDADLSAAGLDLVEARRSGQLVMLDAATTLASVSGENGPDPAAFEEVIGTLVAGAVAAGRGVCAFGEMVALLWDAGDVSGAIELERLWCGLGERMAFDLLCAYPSAVLVEADGVAAANEVCDLHSSVHATATEPRPTYLRAYSPSLQSVTQARRHLTAALDGVDPEALGAASLIVTELASNAVRHARTEFVVEVTHRGDVVRVAVRDRNDGSPTPGALSDDLETGRGLKLLAALSRRWGVDFTAPGKVVWAEIGLP